MTPIENTILSELDFLRSKVLKWAYSFVFFKTLILSRSSRMFTLGLIVLFFYFAVCLYFPLGVLLIGPILWGAPHLVSSLRYNALLSFKPDQKKKLMLIQSFLWLVVFAYRISIDLYQKQIFLAETPLLFEGLCLVFSFLIQLFLNKKYDLSSFFYSLIFAAILYCTHYFPVQTALSLLIGHNYVPLIVWFRSCQNRQDLNVFFCLSVIYISLSLLIYFGAFDSMSEMSEAKTYLDFLKWDYNQVIDSVSLFRLASLYAFSQSIHYFLWMKAIPENFQNQQYAPSFRTSFKLLKFDFGRASIFFILAFVFLGAAFWLVFEFQTARVIYFGLASYHGFMELSALPFLKPIQKIN